MTDPESLSRQMLDRLTVSGELSLAWSEAFAAIPRHRFIPDTIWITDGAGLVPLHRSEDPQEWMRRAYGPAAVITQVDDGHPAGPGERGHYITSSASQPDVVALMLAALDAQPGMGGLEIGTGTGYNAALLAHRLGTQNVTSIEIDPELANHARRALTSTGYPVTVVTGDGADGYPDGALYDRIMSTAAVRQVPYPWVVQTRPGGTILTPWGTPYHNGALASFTVNSDGGADGRVVGNVAFMRLRDQRFRATVDDEECDETTARHSHTTVAPYNVASDYDASLAIGMRVPNCTNIYVPANGDSDYARLWFVDPTTDSWANLVHRPGADDYPVHQSGPRNLWDEIETAYRWWRDAGRPGPQRWRITITPEGQQATLTQASPPARPAS
ncbi:MAG: methyltransferase domain-containing protein [Pseudonocardiales bacterium]|nr:methyltransferase domain-containing protein [Pseudonocardiales bacterium]